MRSVELVGRGLEPAKRRRDDEGVNGLLRIRAFAAPENILFAGNRQRVHAGAPVRPDPARMDGRATIVL